MKSLKELLKIAEKNNIAEDLDEQRLHEIGSMCNDGYKDDLISCTDRFAALKDYIEIAKQVVQSKTDPWPGAANAKFPLLTVAAMQFNARSYPALIPAGKVVNARHFGEDTTGEKVDRARRLSEHMSYQLLYGIDDWQENMDTLLLQIPIVGMMFKKTYRDTVKRRTASSLLMPDQLVMNNDSTKTVETCPRVTELLTRHPYQIQGNMESGLWLDIDLVYDDEENEEVEEILEQHALLDIYDDGNKEPYIVTIHKETGKVLRIKAGFDEDTIFIEHNNDYKSYGEVRRSIENQNMATQRQNMESAQVAAEAQANGVGQPAITLKPIPELKTSGITPLCVEKIQFYTEYGYLPSFDGKYYKAGLGDLISSLSGLIDTNLNQMLDAGTLANLQGGLRQKIGKGKAGKIPLRPGEFPEVDTGGVPLRDSIYQFNFPGPSQVLFALLGMLIDAARDITSIKDIMVGEAPQGETATTTMIKREEGMKVFSAIYKRIHRSMSKEFKKLYTLNRKYLKQGEYFRFGDSQSYISAVDYEDDSLDVIPVADPNESTMQERLMKAEALMNFLGDPDANPVEIKKNYITAMGFAEEEYARFFPGAQPTPPPPEALKIMAEVKEIEGKIESLKFDNALKQAKIIETIANAESKEIGTQLDIYKQAMEELLNGVQSSGVEGMGSGSEGKGGLQATAPGMVGGQAQGILE
ncbi:MAG: hypothetical protein GY714_18040 [Desulfobacterales bacterium]|nr:hypothetical protein [Desulfobacterales bacterium]